MTPLAVIIMGSKADLAHAQKISEACINLGLDTVVRIGSAHKTPVHVLSMLKEYEEDPRPKVYITVAGRSNALSGFVDGAVASPVIACPPPSEAFSGVDIYSSLRMPSGIAPAVILEPANAALLAAKIIGLSNPVVRARVREIQTGQANKLLMDDSSGLG
jgi:5-(carboxyamino)imidazole ribonucleotide mutase